MKQFALAMTLLLCLLPAALMTVFIGERGNRQAELDRALDRALEQTLRTTYLEGHFPIDSAEEMVADVLQNVVLQLESSPKLTLTLYGADYERGYLDIGIEAAYDFPGTKGFTVESRHACILEVKQE